MTSSKRLVAIHPLLSERPTGMGMAAWSIAEMLNCGLAERAPGFDRAFIVINDRVPFGFLRMGLRFALAQFAPLRFWRRKLLFTSHHAPVWRTRRHAVVVHDLIALKHPEQSPVQAWFYRLLMPRLLRSASRVVSISASAADEIARRFSGSLATRIEIIPSTSPLLSLRSRRGLPVAGRREGANFAFLGARYPHKNLGLALVALKALRERAPSRRPRMTVTSCDRRHWPELGEMEESGAVVVRDYASNSEIAALLEHSMALVFVSREEGQGLPPLEAMHAGCPVVCADIPVLREVCGDAAWYVDPDDAGALSSLLSRMLTGELDAAIEQRRQMGLERALAFQPERIRERWAQFLAQWP